MADVNATCLGGLIFFIALLFMSLRSNKPNKRFISTTKHAEGALTLTLYINDQEIWAIFITKCICNPSSGWLMIQNDDSHEWFPKRELAITKAEKILNNKW